MYVLATIFHGYPIEWCQLVIAVAAVIMHAYGCFDSVRAWFAVRAIFPNRKDLDTLAIGDLETATWRMLQQVALVIVGVVGVLMAPPPPYDLSGLTHTHPANVELQVQIMRTCLIANSMISIVKEIRAIMTRHTVLEIWRSRGGQRKDDRPEV